MPRPAAINLLPKTEFETSFWGRFLKWSLTAGRYIIILTEMVVIMAFLSRFKLDKDLLDLSDSIGGKRNILEATYQIEQDFRSAQSRIDQAKQILNATPSATKLVEKITTVVPVGLSLLSVDITSQNGQVALKGEATSEQLLAQYLGSLSADKTWKEVNVDNIQNGQGIINFALSIKF